MHIYTNIVYLLFNFDNFILLISYVICFCKLIIFMLLNEVSPNCALLSILDKISYNSPNKIHKAGYSFDNYNKRETFSN